MRSQQQTKLERRIIEAAEAALDEKRYVAPVDVLLGLGWLAPTHLDHWRQGRVASLEEVVQPTLSKVSRAMTILQEWAGERGLQPNETDYVARTRDRRPLQFSTSGDPSVEQTYRTHWVSPELSERERERLRQRASAPPDLVVVIPLNEWTCGECAGTGDLLIMDEPGPLCMTCADMDHLVFLPSGNAALTRRARKASGLSAVVVRFSRARKRYERQGILVEEAALERAEAQCLADEEARARRRERDEARREAADQQLQAGLAEEIRRLFPGCESDRAEEVARHTAARGSGRVGRTAAARDLDPQVVELAVAASVRHRDTRYDQLLMSGVDRRTARAQVQPEVARVLDAWRQPPSP